MGHKPRRKRQRKEQEKPPSVPPSVIDRDEQGTPAADAGKPTANATPLPSPVSQRRARDTWMCIATVVIAIATTVYAGVAIWQLGTMKSQLQQMQLSSRAWVGCRGVSCAPIVADQPFGVTLALKNTGQTPANKVKIGFAVHAGERDCDIESVAAGRADRAMIDIPEGRAIPPAIDIRMANFATGVDNTCLAKMKDGTSVLYVFGEVVYQDVFGERHMTAYCWVVDPNTWKLNAYKQYNYMY